MTSKNFHRPQYSAAVSKLRTWINQEVQLGKAKPLEPGGSHLPGFGEILFFDSSGLRHQGGVGIDTILKTRNVVRYWDGVYNAYWIIDRQWYHIGCTALVDGDRINRKLRYLTEYKHRHLAYFEQLLTDWKKDKPVATHATFIKYWREFNTRGLHVKLGYEEQHNPFHWRFNKLWQRYLKEIKEILAYIVDNKVVFHHKTLDWTSLANDYQGNK